MRFATHQQNLTRLFVFCVALPFLLATACAGRPTVTEVDSGVAAAAVATPATAATSATAPTAEVAPTERPAATNMPSDAPDKTTTEMAASGVDNASNTSAMANEGPMMAAGTDDGDSGAAMADLSSILAADMSDGARAIALVNAMPDIVGLLDQFGAWEAVAYQSDNPDEWYVDFYTVEGEEWIGKICLSVLTGEVTDRHLPRILSDEAYEATAAAVLAYVLADPEVAAIVTTPDDWYRYIDYDRYGQDWYVYLERGLDALEVSVWADDDGSFYLNEISDPNALSEAEARNEERDAALTLAFEADGLWEALSDVDDWEIYAEPLGDNLWSVAFTTTDRELFYVEVDIEAGTVVASE